MKIYTNSVLIIIFIIMPSIMLAETCSSPYDKSSLPYPSRQALCPNGDHFIDYLTGKSYPCEEAQVDHVIPTKLMYSHGVCGERLKSFSADKDNLRLTWSRHNLEKSNKNPFLYAARHGDQAQETVQSIVEKMAVKYPEISISKLKEEAASLKDSEIRLLYRQKNRALRFARLQAETERKITRRISSRMIRALGRNSSLTAADATAPWLAPIAIAAIAWDIKDTCDNLDDIQQLSKESDIRLDNDTPSEFRKFCGLSKDEILAMLGVNRAFTKCITARMDTNSTNPPECDGIDLNVPSYERKERRAKSEVEVPKYD